MKTLRISKPWATSGLAPVVGGTLGVAGLQSWPHNVAQPVPHGRLRHLRKENILGRRMLLLQVGVKFYSSLQRAHICIDRPCLAFGETSFNPNSK